MNEITLEDIGPIKDLRIEVSEQGGVYVLVGVNGAGKTKALDAVQALASGTGRIEQRDGAARGEISGFGATLRVARRLSRLGELECASLEGRFSIADLVDPKINDPLAADAKRIKALIQLTGDATAEASLFYNLVGGQTEFDRLIDKDSLSTDDLVRMAAQIKRDLETKSRALESQAERDFTKADAARCFGEGVDLNSPHDSKALADALSTADRNDARLRAEYKAAIEDQKKRADAVKAFDEIKKGYVGKSVADAKDNLDRQIAEGLIAADLCNQLEKKLANAKNTLGV